MAPSRIPTRTPVLDDEEDEASEVAEDDEEQDEEDEQPRKAAGRKTTGESLIRGGWTEGQKQMDKGSSFAQALRLEEKAIVVKFLEDTPYANFRRHWIERSTKEGKQLRAWTCLDTIGKDCPLCEVGDRAQSVAAFNIAVVGDDGQVLLKSWDVGPRLFGVLKGYSNDPKIGPLTKGFFIASKTGKRGTVQHNVSPVSKSALREDYDIEPPTPDELTALGRYDPSIITIPSVKDLRELAEEIADDYE